MSATLQPLNNEIERLNAIIKFNETENSKDKEFDDIVERAKAIFNVPIAVISLIDEVNVWFKAKIGIEADYIPRSISICSYCILSKEVLVVLNAIKDDRFKKNILVTGEPYISFYAGAPIIVPDGLIIGALCIVDTEPRDMFSNKESMELSKLASSASSLIQKMTGLL